MSWFDPCETCVEGTACYQNYLKKGHKAGEHPPFERIAVRVWIRRSWLNIIWIGAMLVVFIISCYAFSGGSWVYPCEGDGCANNWVQVDDIWTCGPFVHCVNGICEYYDDYWPPYPMWQAAWFFFVLSGICFPIGLGLGWADLLYRAMVDSAVLKLDPVAVRPTDNTSANSNPTANNTANPTPTTSDPAKPKRFPKPNRWPRSHTFMFLWAERLGRDATILSAVSMGFGLFFFGVGVGSTGEISPPVYPCGICGEASGPFWPVNCTMGGDSVGAIGAFLCMTAAALAAFVTRNRRFWLHAARTKVCLADLAHADAEAADLAETKVRSRPQSR